MLLNKEVDLKKRLCCVRLDLGLDYFPKGEEERRKVRLGKTDNNVFVCETENRGRRSRVRERRPLLLL